MKANLRQTTTRKRQVKEEIAQISRAVKNFLVEVVVPFKEGTLDYNYRESLVEDLINLPQLAPL